MGPPNSSSMTWRYTTTALCRTGREKRIGSANRAIRIPIWRDTGIRPLVPISGLSDRDYFLSRSGAFPHQLGSLSFSDGNYSLSTFVQYLQTQGFAKTL